MIFAADAGRHSSRATPSLHDAPHRRYQTATGRRSTYLSPETVQTNPAGSFLGPPSGRRTAQKLGLNRHTVCLYFHKLREVMAAKVDKEFRELFGDDSPSFRLFEGDRSFTKASVGVGGAVPRFGLIHVEPFVFPVEAPGEIAMLNPRLRGTCHEQARAPAVHVIDTLEYAEQLRSKVFNPSDLEIINQFVVTAYNRLQRLRGFPTHHFYLFLKECAFLTTYSRHTEEWLAAEMGFEWCPIERHPKEYTPAEIEAWKAHWEELKNTI